MPKEVVEARPGVTFNVGDLNVKVTKAVHSDPDTVGFRFEASDMGGVGYTSDTELFDRMGKLYRGVKLLLLCLLRPSGTPWKGHMTPDDAIRLLQEVNPELAVITHFGMKMIFAGPRREAERIEMESGVRTVAARDGMRIRMDQEVKVGSGSREQRGLEEFA
jgi:phosphoribosyl 1,2-cyclic phosphodiesterase